MLTQLLGYQVVTIRRERDRLLIWCQAFFLDLDAPE